MSVSIIGFQIVCTTEINLLRCELSYQCPVLINFVFGTFFFISIILKNYSYSLKLCCVNSPVAFELSEIEKEKKKKKKEDLAWKPDISFLLSFPRTFHLFHFPETVSDIAGEKEV